MAEPTHTELRLSLGSYVLGSLDPADRAAIDAHLPGCPACREELASYAALPALMSRVSIDQLRQHSPPVPPAVLSRALDAVALDRAGTLTQLHRWRRATVLSVAAAAIVAVLFGATLGHTRTSSPPEGTALVAAAGVSASGSALLQAKPWGTAVGPPQRHPQHRRHLDTCTQRTRHPHRGSKHHRHHPRSPADHARRHHSAHPALTPVTTSSQLSAAITIGTKGEGDRGCHTTTLLSGELPHFPPDTRWVFPVQRL